MANWLSQNSETGITFEICSSASKETNQVISHTVSAILWYSASADERDTTCCFLHFQAITVLPKVIHKLLNYCRVK